MGTDQHWDAIIFGELTFPNGGLDAWQEEVAPRLKRLAAFDAAADEELMRIAFAPHAVAIRAWLLSASFQEFCQSIEALCSAAARAGARGDVVFAGIGEGPAYRLDVADGRTLVNRIAAPDWNHPVVQEVSLSVEIKHERRLAEKLGHAKAPALAASSHTSGR
jgi:hypothetical protein